MENGWFKESSVLWPGQGLSLKVKEVLFSQRSEYQDVLCFESESHGNVLVLDGVIQATERDEFAYQEMIAHVPLNCHPNPKSVLVIGGGDGAVLREVVKHECVEKVVLVEIDAMVISVSKKFLPAMAVGFSHPKVQTIVMDGFKYLADLKEKFDVIITDSSDPVGPAEALFEDSFYQLLKSALTDNGIICSQGESIWLHLPIIQKLIFNSRKLFKRVNYFQAAVPTYPSGQIGFLICGNLDLDFSKPVRKFDQSFEHAKLKYYNSQIHTASFVLPQFAAAALQ